MLTDKELNSYYEDDTQLEIPKEFLEMSPEELEKKAEELRIELKRNPLYPARAKTEIQGIKFCI